MRELEYPFDSEYVLKKAKSLKKALLSDGSNRIKKKVAVLGGSTTHDIIKCMELFLLNYGIEPEFYESEYNMYWQDAMFGNETLSSFEPDIIYIHTSNRNITSYPTLDDSKEEIENLLQAQMQHFTVMWDKLRETYKCPVIQNNMEMPFYRLLGNMDAYESHGRLNFVNSVNAGMYEYAASHDDFYICDINYLSACFGLDKWSDPFFWHMYKYALCMQAIPSLSYNVAGIIKSIYGKNKKALVLDLDNTLWGGIVGDDGPENIEIGQETSMGQVYSEFQSYIKSQKQLGVLLTVDSKNEMDNALAGLNRVDSTLKPDDFLIIKANWDPKSKNLSDIAREINIGEDALVFVDDNPAEREIIRQQNPGVAVPEIGTPEQYIRNIDHAGYFEVISISEDDRKRNDMYKANVARAAAESSIGDYGAYLESLEMKADIKPFESMYMSRIAQLTNKSNQFNLTTKRYTQSEIEEAAADENRMTLYGRLEDKFGDNGVVTLMIGRQEDAAMHIELWLMSCRVLKRDMEVALMDEVARICYNRSVKDIYGYYYPTAKNAMVKEFYKEQGFELVKADEEGNSIWHLAVDEYAPRNKYIKVNDN